MPKTAPSIMPIGTMYELTPASTTTNTLGPTGGTGDYLRGLIIIPTASNPGAVSIQDGSNTAISVYTASSSGMSIAPVDIELRVHSVSGPWKVTTGAGVQVIGIGQFT